MNLLNKLLNSHRKKTYGAYKKGIEYYNRLKFSDAIEHFQQVRADGAMKKTLEFKLATFYCGLAYRNLGIVQFTRNNNENALSYFKKAQQCNPGHIDLNYFIGICLNNIGQFKEAMTFFKMIQEIEPWNVPNKLKMAVILHNLKMWGTAEKIYKSLLEKNPNFADIHFHLGLTLMNQGKTTEAIDAFRKAVHINPNYINARIKLGSPWPRRDSSMKPMISYTTLLKEILSMPMCSISSPSSNRKPMNSKRPSVIFNGPSKSVLHIKMPRSN